MKDESKFDQFCREIENGPFSILSVSAKDQIKAYIRLAMEDGFDRGVKYGEKAAYRSMQNLN
jgi:hypothetical protein